ncbi:MAG: hypothetical protein LBS80_02170, partial [Tannerella sp.]|nr:hypothetical protein [Tannerella sp.]
DEIPKNGIYILFEKGELFGDLDRIVRVGTHTGDNRLRSRLNQQFVQENKNRSIFRKNIGRCLLNKDNCPYLSKWELDTTSRADKEKYLKLLDLDFEKKIEKKISEYIQTNFSFCVFSVDTKEERLFWESKIISTIAQSNELKPSQNWLGKDSPEHKIRERGLWQVRELDNETLNQKEFDELKQLILNNLKEIM